MNVTWIIDPDAFDYSEQLVREIQAQGHTAKTLPPFFSSYEFGDTSRYCDELAPANSCVVCHASFEFTELVAQDELWTPGTYGNSAAVDYTSYSNKLADYLLNSEHELIQFNQLAANAEYLFNRFAVDDRIFVRPDSGRKPFTGRLYSKSEFENLRLSSSRMSAKSLLIISRPKSIAREWRFIVVDGEIVAASIYKEFDRILL